jgi:protein phosphatase slingshot
MFYRSYREVGKKVLVHCKMGISRSAATVTAFAMKEYRMSLKDALSHVKGRRSVVNPNDGFVAQLRDYEGILQARCVLDAYSLK